MLTARLMEDFALPEQYAELAGKIRQSFRKHFFDTSTGSMIVNSQTSLVCILFQGLAEEKEIQLILSQLEQQLENDDYHINAEILGTQYLMEALSATNRTDLAIKNRNANINLWMGLVGSAGMRIMNWRDLKIGRYRKAQILIF